MMKTQQKISGLLVLVLILTASMIVPSDAQARSWKYKQHPKKYSRKQPRYNRHQRHYPRRKSYSPYSYGTFHFSLPIGNISIYIGGRKYHYYGGHYYRPSRMGYMAVEAPVGAHIPYLPYGYEKIYVDGTPHYIYNDIYYNETSRGYVVVKKPDLTPRKKSKEVSRNVGKINNDITVNIPNNRGGYTSVTLKQVKNGYIGPQGEYYKDFPKIEKLKRIYGT